MFSDSFQVHEGERPLKMPRKTSSENTPSKPAWKRKRARVSTLMRREICTYKRDHPNATHEAIGRIFKVARTTVGRALKDKARWLCPDTIVSDKYHRLWYDPRTYHETSS